MKTDKNIVELLGEKADFYLEHVCEKITKDEIYTHVSPLTDDS